MPTLGIISSGNIVSARARLGSGSARASPPGATGSRWRRATAPAGPVPAVLSIAGHSYPVDRTPRQVTLSVAPGRKPLVLRMTVRGDGHGGRASHTVTIPRR